MRQVVVGTYRLGDLSVQLVLCEGVGGDFYFQPGDIAYPRVKVGADSCWGQVIAVLLHELEEVVLSELCLRYTPWDEFGRDNASYIFVMRHEQFSDVVSRAAGYAVECMADLHRAWYKWQKKAKKGR